MLFDVMDIIGDAAKGVLDRIFYPNEDSIPRRRSDNRSSNVNVRRIQDGYRDSQSAAENVPDDRLPRKPAKNVVRGDIDAVHHGQDGKEEGRPA